MTTTMRLLGTLLVALLLGSPAHAGWHADCRHAAKLCRQTRGDSLTTTTTTSTTPPTTLPVTLQAPSQNCEPIPCVQVNGEPFCSFLQTITKCHVPVPSPACHLDLATDEEGCNTPCVICDGTRYCESGAERACVCAHAASVCPAP
jgi:hypothetical protein